MKILVTAYPANIRLDEDVLKTYSRRLDQDQYICLGHTSSKRLQNVFKTSSRRLQDIFEMPCKNVFKDVLKMSLRCLAKTSQRRFQNVFKTSCIGVFKTFSRGIIKLKCSCWQVFKTSSRRIHHVFERYCEEDYLQKDLPRSHFWEIYGQCTKISKSELFVYTETFKIFFLKILLSDCFYKQRYYC